MKSFIVSALMGFAALFAVNLAAPYTGVAIALNRLSLAASGVLGIPGVTLMVILNMILL